MKDKNVDFNAGKWKNEMTHPGMNPGPSALKSGVLTPTPQNHQENWQKNYGSHYSVAKSGKKLLIFKAGNSNQDKFKTLKAPRMHIFQAASKKIFEFTS